MPPFITATPVLKGCKTDVQGNLADQYPNFLHYWGVCGVPILTQTCKLAFNCVADAHDMES